MMKKVENRAWVDVFVTKSGKLKAVCIPEGFDWETVGPDGLNGNGLRISRLKDDEYDDEIHMKKVSSDFDPGDWVKKMDYFLRDVNAGT